MGMKFNNAVKDIFLVTNKTTFSAEALSNANTLKLLNTQTNEIINFCFYYQLVRQHLVYIMSLAFYYTKYTLEGADSRLENTVMQADTLYTVFTCEGIQAYIEG